MIKRISFTYKHRHYMLKFPKERNPIFVITSSELRRVLVDGIGASMFDIPLPVRSLGISRFVITTNDGKFYRYPMGKITNPLYPAEHFMRSIVGKNPLPDSSDYRINRLMCEKASSHLRILSEDKFKRLLWDDPDALTVVTAKEKLIKYPALSRSDKELVKHAFRFVWLSNKQPPFQFLMFEHDSVSRFDEQRLLRLWTQIPQRSKTQIIVITDCTILMSYPFYSSGNHAVAYRLVPNDTLTARNVADVMYMRSLLSKIAG